MIEATIRLVRTDFSSGIPNPVTLRLKITGKNHTDLEAQADQFVYMINDSKGLVAANAYRWEWDDSYESS